MIRPYLVHIVDRYGPAIEADLHQHFGLDLVDFFRGRHKWPKLLRLLGMLPSSSHYQEARLNDQEFLQALADAGHDFEADSGRKDPPLSTYTPEVARLDALRDEVKQLTHLVAQVAGGKPGKFTPEPRPKTGVEAFVNAQRAKRQESFLDEIASAQKRRAARSNTE